VLRLASRTDPAWTALALERLDDVLLDHAHCEKKAAGGALRLLFQYPDARALQEPLAALAREELEHFERTLAELQRRGVEFRRQKPSAYGGRLRTLVRGREPERLVDLLLVSALIEARSCERMQRLAEAIEEPQLAGFYADLLACEARHHQVYVDLACESADSQVVARRLAELAPAEAAILREPAPFVRMHSGSAPPPSASH
jgi:tRNA-(ms[2]io[6]A)-hydroxylase